MRYIPFILLLILLFTLPALPQTIIPGGDVSGVWTLEGSPYWVEGEIIVPRAQTLIIDPGVDVIFQDHYKFTVAGMLQAVGTEIDTIVFTASNANTGWNGLRFYDLNSQADSSRLVYCKLTYGKTSTENDDDKHGGAIFASDSDKLLISNCLFANNYTAGMIGENGVDGSGSSTTFGNPGEAGESVESGNGGAIYLLQSSPLISSSTFAYNETGSAVGGTGGNGETMTGGSWTSGGYGGIGGDGSSGHGGALYCCRSNLFLVNNIFFGNQTGTGSGGGGGRGGAGINIYGAGLTQGGPGGAGGEGRAGYGGAIFAKNSNLTLQNNLFYNNQTNSGSGGEGGHGGAAFYSVAMDVTYGGGGGHGGSGFGGDGATIYLLEGSVNMSSCTVTGDRPGPGCPGYGGPGGSGDDPGATGAIGGEHDGVGAIWSHTVSNYSISNTIIWNVHSIPLPPSYNVSFSCIEGGFPGTGNIDVDPLFAGDQSGYYFLSQIAAGQALQSPCVDAGDPAAPLLVGTTRTDGILDENIIDMGFHYSYPLPQGAVFVDQQELYFEAAYGGINPPMQVFEICTHSFIPFSYHITTTEDWITTNPQSGGPISHSTEITVIVDTENLSLGLYQADIIVEVPGFTGSPLTIPVQLNVGESILVVEPLELVIYATYGGANPPPSTISIANSGVGYFNYSILENAGWLMVDPASGGPIPPADSIDVIIDIAGLAIGTYEENILIEAAGAVGSPQTIHVILCVGNFLGGELAGVIHENVYYVMDNIYVSPGDSLIIEPGTELQFMADSYFVVYGYLHAAGSMEDTIKFIPANDSTSWGGIRVSSSTDSSKFEYCLISGSNQTGLTCYSDRGTVFSHCLVTQNSLIAITSMGGGGVKLTDSNPEFHNCTISENFCDTNYGGGGIFISGDPAFYNCYIQGNISSNLGGGIVSSTGSPLFYSCVISDNEAQALYGYGGGAYVLSETGSPSFVNCNFIDNNIQGSFQIGGALYLSGNGIEVRNCIFTENIGAAVYFSNVTSGSVDFNNFFDNPDGNFAGTLPPNLGTLSQTNVNGDSCDVYHNIFLDPLFVDPDSGDYHLLEGSPCIDAGDPLSVWDPDSTIADIGAFYFHQQPGGLTDDLNRRIPQDFCLLPAYPNPFNPQTTIRFGLPAAAQVKITVYDIRGRQVAALIDGWRQAGYHDVTFAADNLASGVYIYRIAAAEFRASSKLLLLK